MGVYEFSSEQEIWPCPVWCVDFLVSGIFCALVTGHRHMILLTGLVIDKYIQETTVL